jgi:hypothetical protein
VHVVAVLAFICGGCRSTPVVAFASGRFTEQVSHETPRANHKMLIQSSRKAAARTGEAIVGVAKTAGRFVGWVFVKTIDGFFGVDVDASDPVRATRDRELDDWTESREKWVREDRSRQ